MAKVRDAENCGEFMRIYINLPDGSQYHNSATAKTRDECILLMKEMGSMFCRMFGLRELSVSINLMTRDQDGHAEPIEYEIVTYKF